MLFSLITVSCKGDKEPSENVTDNETTIDSVYESEKILEKKFEDTKSTRPQTGELNF